MNVSLSVEVFLEKTVAMVTFQNVYIPVIFYVLVLNVILAATKNLTLHAKKSVFKHKNLTARDINPSQPQLRIKNGATVVGVVETTVDQNKTYYSFKGIPYAKPPVGELRFKPPVPLSGNFSQKIINATEDASVCVQPGPDLLPNSVIGSEDCLYINVYTPRLPNQNVSLLPVMVWIYGGAFVVGDSRYSTFGPDYFMDVEDVMIVSFNYRLGIFGFLSTEDAAAPGNYGLKDQILALNWVNKNIQFFGGNPKQITIFGESAGAVSVSYLTQTPLTTGLFQRAIMESGTSLNLWGLTRQPLLIAVATATILKVDVSNSQTLVDGLRKIDYKKLLYAQTATNYAEILLLNPLDGLPFGPTMEPDFPGAIVVNKSHEQLSNGLFHHVPYIIGFNSQEAIPFIDVVNLLRLYLVKYDINPVALVPASMNIYDTFIKENVNSIIKSYYFGIVPVALSDQQLIQFASDTEFVRPILEATRLYSQESPTYLYQFSYEGSTGSGNRTGEGVGHAEELPYFWRQSSNHAYATQSDKLTRRRLIKMWTNFAKTGNPTPYSDPLLENVKWPQARPNNLAYLNIDKNLTSIVNPFWKNFVWWKQLFGDYGNAPYSTY